ncbi:MAG TPA: hypothetical protein VH877_19185 [Polyangia bacterium]|jgi:hypothetical protein|nr:hypothetical protein [Polyangia bacterium]
MTLRLRKLGGTYQFVVQDDTDLEIIDRIDPARWAATSVPRTTLHCDPAFLAALDPEGTGRIRVSQLIAARQWLFERITHRGRLRERSEVLFLSDLDTTRIAGQELRKAAERVVAELRLANPMCIALAELRAFRQGYKDLLANGDGVIPAELVGDEALAAVVRDVMATAGSAPDASGKGGVGLAEIDRFVERGRAWLAWQAAAVQPLGEDTEAAAGLIQALDAKIEEYFWVCELLRKEAQPPELLRLAEADLRTLGTADSPVLTEHFTRAALAMPLPSAELALDTVINPVYRERFAELRTRVLERVLGPGTRSLTYASWEKVKATFAGYFAWQREKPSEPFQTLGAARVQALLAGPELERLRELSRQDAAAGAELAKLDELEKLILLQRWLLDLANNFVNFSAIYDPAQTSLVERGSLVIDGRRLEFCVPVEDRAAHKAVAHESLLFLVYAQIIDKERAAPAYEVVAPVTSGERGRLRVGKRGIFIDTAGKEWDAVIVDLVDNPISLLEAIKAPFRRAAQFVQRKVEELTQKQQAAQEDLTLARIDKSVTQTNKALENASKEKARQELPEDAPKSKDSGSITPRDLLLGGGIALAAVGSALAYLVTALSRVEPLHVLAALGSVFAVIILVSGFLGWLKLRRRDMSLVLEASGWAVNLRIKITRGVGRLFAFEPAWPEGAVKDKRDLVQDPSERSSWPLVLIIGGMAVAGAAYYYYVYLNGR